MKTPRSNTLRDPEGAENEQATDLLSTQLGCALQSLGRGLRDAILIVDRRHRLVWLNAAAENLTGVGATEAVGRHCYEVMKCAANNGVRGCAGLSRGGGRLRRSVGGRDGATISVAATRLPLSPLRSKCAGAVCSLVPENPEMDLDRTRTEFLSNVSHELRTPLTSLAASIELLMNCDEGIPEDVGGVLRVMHRSTLWLHNLVENLLCASSIQVGRFQVDPQPSSLLEILDEAASFVMPLLEKKQQTLRCDLPAELSPVMADAQRIGQVLINLLHNASKYGPTYDLIGLTVVDSGLEYRISVSEHGPGIPAQERDRLFERFYRRRPSGGDGRPGIGLGLGIVRSIVELHGGSVGVESVLGEGSTFWFTLLKADASDLERFSGQGLPQQVISALGNVDP